MGELFCKHLKLPGQPHSFFLLGTIVTMGTQKALKPLELPDMELESEESEAVRMMIENESGI